MMADAMQVKAAPRPKSLSGSEMQEILAREQAEIDTLKRELEASRNRVRPDSVSRQSPAQGTSDQVAANHH